MTSDDILHPRPDQRWYICRHISTNTYYVRCFNPLLNPNPTMVGYEFLHPCFSKSFARSIARDFNITLSN